MSSTRINVGCGRTPTPGWRNFDNSWSLLFARSAPITRVMCAIGVVGPSQLEYIHWARQNGIERADAVKHLPLTSGSVDALYTSHMLEHLDRRDAVAFLQEAWRVLRLGGIIRISVPDLSRYVSEYQTSGDADAFLDATRLCEPRARSVMERLRAAVVGPRHHLWMYDGNSLARLLQSRGFCNVQFLPPGRTTIPNPGQLDLTERASVSIFVEAQKSETAYPSGKRVT